MARFQARSAFTGVGYTISEAEQAVKRQKRVVEEERREESERKNEK
jgi:hypothetical protein